MALLTFDRGVMAAADEFEGFLADCQREGIDPKAMMQD